MKTIKVSGKACPYGVANSFGEILSPGIFRNTLAKRKSIFRTKSIPMLICHGWDGVRQQAGEWTKWEDREDGLYVKGELDSLFLPIIDIMGLKELSISYSLPANINRPYTNARLASNIMRFGFPSKNIKLHNVGEQFTFGPEHVECIDEISLVDSGAYKGCGFTLEVK